MRENERKPSPIIGATAKSVTGSVSVRAQFCTREQFQTAVDTGLNDVRRTMLAEFDRLHSSGELYRG